MASPGVGLGGCTVEGSTISQGAACTHAAQPPSRQPRQHQNWGFIPGDPVDAGAFERLYRSFADPRRPAFSDTSVFEADKLTLGSRPAQFTEETGRKPVYFLDLTFSPPKFVTLLHTGLLAKAAERQHHHPDEALVLRAQAELVWEAVMAGSAAVVASFRRHTSRNGDPQLHVHNPVLNRVPCDIDGKWRALDSRAVHAARLLPHWPSG
ncbi:relaxase domain-containing protein [Nonomuraea rubra]